MDLNYTCSSDSDCHSNGYCIFSTEPLWSGGAPTTVGRCVCDQITFESSSSPSSAYTHPSCLLNIYSADPGLTTALEVSLLALHAACGALAAACVAHLARVRRLQCTIQTLAAALTIVYNVAYLVITGALMAMGNYRSTQTLVAVRFLPNVFAFAVYSLLLTFLRALSAQSLQGVSVSQQRRALIFALLLSSGNFLLLLLSSAAVFEAYYAALLFVYAAMIVVYCLSILRFLRAVERNQKRARTAAAGNGTGTASLRRAELSIQVVKPAPSPRAAASVPSVPSAPPATMAAPPPFRHLPVPSASALPASVTEDARKHSKHATYSVESQFQPLPSRPLTPSPMPPPMAMPGRTSVKVAAMPPVSVSAATVAAPLSSPASPIVAVARLALLNTLFAIGFVFTLVALYLWETSLSAQHFIFVWFLCRLFACIWNFLLLLSFFPALRLWRSDAWRTLCTCDRRDERELTRITGTAATARKRSEKRKEKEKEREKEAELVVNVRSGDEGEKEKEKEKAASPASTSNPDPFVVSLPGLIQSDFPCSSAPAASSSSSAPQIATDILSASSSSALPSPSSIQLDAAPAPNANTNGIVSAQQPSRAAVDAAGASLSASAGLGLGPAAAAAATVSAVGGRSLGQRVRLPPLTRNELVNETATERK